MARVELGRLIGRQKGTSAILGSLMSALGTPLAVEELDGRLIQGSPVEPGTPRFPVVVDTAEVGWVAGGDHAAPVAAMLTHLLAREAERKQLGSEVLHLYREINLIYNFSERLAALLDLEAVARTALNQARHLIVATEGAVLLLDESTGELRPLATFGDPPVLMMQSRSGEGIVGAIVERGTGEIVNDVEADPRQPGEASVATLIGAPLKVGERVVGVIVLTSSMPLVYSAGDLKLLNTLALQSASAIENARLFERTVEAARERERLLALQQATELARAKLESEMELAARIQADLFPASLPRISGYDLAACNRPARQCGGDYYDALPVPGFNGDPHVLLCVADVSGKGLPASLLMANMQATLRALVGRMPSLADLAALANELLFATTAANRYVTAVFGVLDPGAGQVRYVSAGHTNSLLLRHHGEAAWLTSTGPPLGLLPPGLPYGESTAAMEPGDTLFLFSDGIVDAQDLALEEFGEDRLLAAARATAGLPASVVAARVVEAVDAHAGAAPQFDDITLLVLGRDGP
ncbi:MAG: PP2C family protein-serine/threonine phosphatase [Acidobacteriota bacterium]